MDFLRLSVSEFNQIFADIVHNQLQLNQLCICGEITQLNQYQDHLYLTISDKNAHLPSVIYSISNKKIPFIKKGDHIEIIGQCRFLKNKGQLMFSGQTILPKGQGKKRNERTKQLEQYEKKGAFTVKNLDQLPEKLNRVCIITAADSAAYHDIVSILEHTTHTFDVLCIPSSMQGLNAEQDLIAALSIAESISPDLICISRGGGAEHDFDCFFSDSLATKILSISCPIICGIGHKINTTLSCLVANHHFETPTAMIQWACHHSTKPIKTIEDKITQIEQQLIQSLNEYKLTVEVLNQKATTAIYSQLQTLQNIETNLTNQLEHLNPLNKIGRGYGFIQTEKKAPVTSIQQLETNDTIHITLKNGSVKAIITHVNNETA